jgi:cytochrome c oxidase cbb3-type subunit II
LGSQRIGPDLANCGRLSDTNGIFMRRIFMQLYDPRLLTTGSVMPPYRFLFETRKIGLFPARDALDLPSPDAPPPGYEIVPRPQARALAAYLASLRQDEYLFEAPPPPQPKTNTVPKNAASTNAVPAAAKPAAK